MSTPDQITAAVSPALRALGLVVEDVTVSRAGRRSVVRVLVDSNLEGLPADDMSTPVPPLSLDAIAGATHAVSDALDGDDVMGEAPYTLEVSSPGVGRALRTPTHFRRQVGRLLTVTGIDGSTTTGRLLEAGPEQLVLETVATKKQPAERITLAHTDVSTGQVQVEFTRVDSGNADESDPADEAHEATDKEN